MRPENFRRIDHAARGRALPAWNLGVWNLFLICDLGFGFPALTENFEAHKSLADSGLLCAERKRGAPEFFVAFFVV